jgi:hypothetical protein
MENMIMASKLDLHHNVNQTVIFQTLVGYALMNQNTTIEGTDINIVNCITVQYNTLHYSTWGPPPPDSTEKILSWENFTSNSLISCTVACTLYSTV